MTRRVVLARHGESEYSAVGLLNGDPSVAVALTGRGREEARRLGEELSREPLDLCVTSGLLRARETADEALRGRDVPRLVLADLNDPRYGRFEGKPLEDYRAWAGAAPSSAEPGPGGESRLAIVGRYARAFRTVLARPEASVLVVCHSLPVAYVLEARAGRPPAVRAPLARHAFPYRLDAAELDAAVRVLERWAAAPTW